MSQYWKSVFISAICLFSTAFSQAQDNPFRIGLKLGIPNIAGLNGEVVTPVKGLAATGDFSWFNFGIGNVGIGLRYFEGGGNYYFFNDGSGLYGHLSYGKLSADLDFDNIESEDQPGKMGSANADLGVNLYNLKAGVKLGYTLYFRAELGFAFASVDDTIDIEVRYPDGTTEEQSQNVPGLVGGGPLINLGFGLAF